MPRDVLSWIAIVGGALTALVGVLYVIALARTRSVHVGGAGGFAVLVVVSPALIIGGGMFAYAGWALLHGEAWGRIVIQIAAGVSLPIIVVIARLFRENRLLALLVPPIGMIVLLALDT